MRWAIGPGREEDPRLLDVVEGWRQRLDDQGTLASLNHAAIRALDQETVLPLDGPVALGEFGMVEKGGFQVLDVINGVEPIRDGDPEVDEIVFTLLPGTVLEFSDGGDRLLDPLDGLRALAGDDATRQGGVIETGVGLNGLGRRGALVLEVFEGVLEEPITDGKPFVSGDRTLNRVRLENPELVWAPLVVGAGGVQVGLGLGLVGWRSGFGWWLERVGSAFRKGPFRTCCPPGGRLQAGPRHLAEVGGGECGRGLEGVGGAVRQRSLFT